MSIDMALEPHTSDQCQFELCSYCKCCAHGKSDRDGCKVEQAPFGMRCPVWECGCEGRS